MRQVKPQDSNRRARGRRKHRRPHLKDNSRPTLLFLKMLREADAAGGKA